MEQALLPKIFQHTVISLLKNRRSFKPEFISQIRSYYQLAEDAQNALIDQLSPQDAPCAEIDCKKGCSHCCGMIVTPTMPELYIILEHLKETYSKGSITELVQHLRDHKRRCAQTTTTTERIDVLCSFLKDHICSIHSVRPLSCRAYTSTDVEKCKEFVAVPTIDIPGSIYHYYPFHITRKAIMKSMYIAGFTNVTEELNSGILRLLEGEFCEIIE